MRNADAMTNSERTKSNEWNYQFFFEREPLAIASKVHDADTELHRVSPTFTESACKFMSLLAHYLMVVGCKRQRYEQLFNSRAAGFISHCGWINDLMGMCNKYPAILESRRSTECFTNKDVLSSQCLQTGEWLVRMWQIFPKLTQGTQNTCVLSIIFNIWYYKEIAVNRKWRIPVGVASIHPCMSAW